MPDYRCYYFDAADHIFEAGTAQLETDAAAVEWGHGLSRSHPTCAKVEIWCGPRLIHTQPCEHGAGD